MDSMTDEEKAMREDERLGNLFLSILLVVIVGTIAGIGFLIWQLIRFFF